MNSRFISAVCFALIPAMTVMLLAGCQGSEVVASAQEEGGDGFVTFINGQEAAALIETHADELFIIDARKPDQFADGHLPGAVNLPPDVWRTPKAKPGSGQPGRHFYRVGSDDAGPLDSEHYNSVLGAAGLTEDAPVLVYGNHAGKADGSVPVMVLHLLGHRGDIFFADGVGTHRFTDAGLTLSTKAAAPTATTYNAQPIEGAVWDLADVRAYVANPEASVVLWDTRSPAEWDGSSDRGNARAGRIPGAVFVGFSDLFTPGSEKTVLQKQAMQQKLTAAGITPEKTVVMYCQTATRVALPYQALREMGYTKLAVYDGSMAEYANLDDTEIELP
ncbi:MAG: rhodanese-like domain-containing protein [Planctomycetota bacterium]